MIGPDYMESHPRRVSMYSILGKWHGAEVLFFECFKLLQNSEKLELLFTILSNQVRKRAFHGFYNQERI